MSDWDDDNNGPTVDAPGCLEPIIWWGARVAVIAGAVGLVIWLLVR